MIFIKKLSKLVLGTAQLGLDYGIANKLGKPSKKNVLDILETAWENEINFFDTAPLYGNSEKNIGEFIISNYDIARNIGVITKMPGCYSQNNRFIEIEEKITESLCKLNLRQIDYYLLHNTSDINNVEIINNLFTLKDKGLIKEIGASVYSIEEAEIAIEQGLKVLQVPVNLFDQRFLCDWFLKKCKKNNVTLIARSVFLQGLFFCSLRSLPAFLYDAFPYLYLLHNICKEEKISLYEVAIKFVNSYQEIDHIIIGTESISQLKENIKAFKGDKFPESIHSQIKKSFNNVPHYIIDPRCWGREIINNDR